MTDSNEKRVIVWLTAAARGREWQIEPARKAARGSSDQDDGPVFLLNYYAVRYGYDLVLAS